jgi:Transmembrane secretion effector
MAQELPFRRGQPVVDRGVWPGQRGLAQQLAELRRARWVRLRAGAGHRVSEQAAKRLLDRVHAVTLAGKGELGHAAIVIGTETLLPALDQTLWHGGSTGYAVLRAAPGMAAVLAGAILSDRRATYSTARVITLSVLGACAGLIGFTQAPDLAVAFVLLLLASLALTTAQVHLVTRVQQVTPDHLRGAISGLSAIAQNGLAGVAAACMALSAASVGARTIITAAAAITAIAVLAGPVRARKFRRALP